MLTVEDCIKAAEQGKEVLIVAGKVTIEPFEMDLEEFQRGVQATFAKAMLFD